MPIDGSGNFTRSHNFVSDKNNGIKIIASRMDAEFDNFASAVNSGFLRSGVIPMTGNLNMGTQNIVALGSGVVGTPAVRFNTDAASGLYMPAAGKVALVAGGVNRIEADSAGAIITGSISVSSDAAITGDATLGGNMVMTSGGYIKGSSTGGFVAIVGGTTFNVDGGSIAVRGSTAGYNPNGVEIYAGAGERISVKSDGKVGIGISAPTQLLDVNGTARVVGATTLSSTLGVTGAATLSSTLNVAGAATLSGTLNVAGTAALNAGGTVTGNWAVTGVIYPGNDGSFALYKGGGNPIVNVDTGDYMVYDRTANIYGFLIGSSYKAQIRSNGDFWADAGVIANGNVYAGNGAAYLQNDGNVIGPVWPSGIHSYIGQRAAEFGSNANGYWKKQYCPNTGTTVIEQWGRITANANGSTTINFPINFTDAGSVSCTCNGAGSLGTTQQDNWPTVYDVPNVSQASVYSADNVPCTVMWKAIGF
jgi:hypothetical protein